MNKPKSNSNFFIKKFKTSQKYYVYDVRSNEIMKVSPRIWDIIDHLEKPVRSIAVAQKEKYSKEDILEAHDRIKNSILFNNTNNSYPTISAIGEDEAETQHLFHNRGIRQLILDLTNRCNMRCKYCVYSGKSRFERTHRNKNMSRVCALKAVDYFIKHSSKEEKASVTFYGGEPLLEFDLFKYIVEYVRSNQKNFSFSLTTNGTLLDGDVVRFLIDNDVSISISLDGPKYVHDKNRVMRSGAGSFDLILKNLRRIKQLDPEYFYSKITYRPVLTPPYDCEDITNFFYGSAFFMPLQNPVQVVPVSTYGTSYIEEKDIAIARQQYKENYRQLFENFKKAIISGKYDELRVEKTWFRDMVELIHFRQKSPLEKHHAAMGQCTPGLNRLFVNPDGKYYMCEKVGEHFCIGDIETGLNFKKISGFYKRWVEFFKDCNRCWALRLCKKCFYEVHRGGRLNKERKESLCRSTLKKLEMLLSGYCEILEQDPDAFKDFSPQGFFSTAGAGK